MRSIRDAIRLGGFLAVGVFLFLQWTQVGTIAWPIWELAGVTCLALAGLWVFDDPASESDDAPDHLDDLEALARQDQLATLGLMAASIAHEIRNVISVIKMRLYLAKRQTDAEIADELESAADSITRLENLTDHLSPYATDADEPDDECRLRDALSGALDIVAPKADDTIELEIDIDANPDISSRNGTFTQVLVNLLLNACDAVQDREEGHIRVRADRRGDRAIVTVVDNGPGIPAGRLDQIFEPFFSTKGDADEGGTGIGLWLCRQLVEEQDGTIWADNPDDTGARFTVEIPLRDAGESGVRTPTGAREFPLQASADEASASTSASSDDDEPTDDTSPSAAENDPEPTDAASVNDSDPPSPREAG